MNHHSRSPATPLGRLRRSDVTLQRMALLAVWALAVLTLAGLIASLVPPAPELSAEPVWVPCSDGWVCAVGPSRGEGRTVDITWVRRPAPPAQEVGPDPGAAL